MTRTRSLFALAALALPTLLVAVDISVLGVALPTMGKDLHASATELLWMTDSYNFMVAGAMLTAGAVADRIGRRQMVLVCAAVFAVASGAGAFATTPEQVIAARGVMGLAGAAIVPTTMALLGGLFTEEKARIQAMGAMMTVFLGGMAVAPFVGGLLLAHFWWGSVFLMAVPVMAVTLAVVPRLVPESRSERPAPLDLTSAALSLMSVLALVFALKRVVTTGLDLPVVVASASGLALGALFVRRQRRLPHPLLDLDVLARPRVRRTLTALFVTALLMGGTSLLLNLYLQEVQGLTPLRSAWWILPQMVSMIAAANLGPWLNRHLPQRTVVVSMLALMTAGFALYAVAPVSASGRPVVSVGGALATFGIGAAFPMLMDGVISAAPAERAASSASMAQLANELGIALGLTVIGSLSTVVYRLRLGLPGSTAEQSVIDGVREGRHDPSLLGAVRVSFTDSLHVAGALGVGLMVLVLVLAARATGSADVDAAAGDGPGDGLVQELEGAHHGG